MRYSIETIKVKLEVKEGTTKKADSPFNVVNILRGIYADLDSDQEHFTLLALDQKLNVKQFKTLFSGGETSSLVDIKLTLRNALLMGAVSVILAHNHPSGDPKASIDDITMTNRLKEAFNSIDMKITDHIILGLENEFFSFNENNLV